MSSKCTDIATWAYYALLTAPHTIQTNEEDRLSLKKKKMMIGGTLTSSSSSSTAKIILEAFPAEIFRRGGATAEIFPRKTSHLKLLRVDSLHGRILKPIPLRSSSIKVIEPSRQGYLCSRCHCFALLVFFFSADYFRIGQYRRRRCRN